MSSVSDIFLYECKDIYLFNSVKVLNQNPLLNSSAMEASMSFGRTSSLETAVIFFFFFHRSNTAWASAAYIFPQYPFNVP